MFKSTRFMGVWVLGLSLATTATIPSAPGKHVPAVQGIVNLADELDRPNVDARVKQIVDAFDSCDISRIFGPRKHGGAGIGTAVQAGHGDSIQSLVINWAGVRPPRQQELLEHRKDLLKVARVLKVMAKLAPLRLALVVPKSDAKRVEAMHKVTAEFRAVTDELHDAIERAEPVATRAAAIRLDKTCNACHLVAGV
jgi:hypothetical protein